MFPVLIYCTGAICIFGTLIAYLRFKDIFHPLILILPMCGFMYVYMPLKLSKDNALFTFVSMDQAIFCQTMVVLTVSALVLGALIGSAARSGVVTRTATRASRQTLHKGAYIVGGIGFLCWLYTLHGSGGISGAFGNSYGATWSEYGYLRDAAYLVIVGLLLLISPEGIDIGNKVWWIAVALFSFPWGIQALLGARRGPTFMMTVCIGMSWYLARGKRPSVISMILAGGGLGLLMLFLVTNRSSICLNCDFNLKTDVSDVVTNADESNEYIFGTGCIAATRVTGKCYWGRRYAAQVLVRPIPRQIWKNKYTDTGLGELEQNAGVAGDGLQSVMGWSEVKGAAAGMVADLWVEFSWLEVPVAFAIGWVFGRFWRRAVDEQSFWTTEYVILSILSIYLVTQSGEAVIFRLVIMSVPALLVWRKAIKAAEAAGNFRVEPDSVPALHV